MSRVKVVLHSLMLLILFLVCAIIVNPLTDGIENGTLRVAVKELTRIVITSGLLQLYVQWFFRKTNDYYRIQARFKTGIIWVIVAFVMPLLVISFYVFTHFVVFENQELLPLETALAFILASFITACSAGIIEEILFRGYLLKLMEVTWNKVAAVCVTSLLFGALHLLTVNRPSLVDLLLILSAGTLVGVLFSLIVYKTGTVWNAVVVHLVWNFFMNPKIVQFVPKTGTGYPSLMLLRFKSDNVSITGGTFGIEAALPALILYGLIIGGIAFRRGGSMHSGK